MAGKAVATVGSMHVCPMCTGTVPHVGGPVIGPGQPNILMNGKPVAVMGDMCTCVGPPSTIIMGNASILMNGMPVACMGDMTAHGGSIVAGEPNILMSTATPMKPKIMHLKAIAFPKITFFDHVAASLSGNGTKLKEAEKNQEEIKEAATKAEEEEKIEKRLVNYYFTDLNDIKINSCSIGDKIYLLVETKNMAGHKMDIQVPESCVDFEYNGKRIENNLVKDYSLKGDLEKIPLTVMEKDQDIYD